MAATRGNLHSLGAAIAACTLLLVTTAATPYPSPSPAATLVLRQIGVLPKPTPTPEHHAKLENDEPAKPIPRSWLVGGGIAAALVLAAIVYGALRAWRSSNLFDRQYRFPRSDDVAIRLGGEKCGGHIASASFGVEKSRAGSKTKDT